MPDIVVRVEVRFTVIFDGGIAGGSAVEDRRGTGGGGSKERCETKTGGSSGIGSK